MNTKAPLIAAIDIGTNSFHMVIASVNHRGMLNIINREKEMVRLGSSRGDMKQLLPDAVDRGAATMKRFVEIANSENASIRAVATSAVREANNRQEFRERIKEETGVKIEVISGAEEARLIYIGAMHALPIFAQKALLIDIGGGSTEIAIGHKGQITYVHSAKLGAIRLTKRFFPKGISTPERIEECRDYIRGDWSPTMKRVIENGFETVVGTAGTIQNIIAMAMINKARQVPDIINGVVVGREDILEVIEMICEAKTPEDRAEIPGMDPKRADIIIGGALILEHAIRHLNIQHIITSSYALREGLVFDTVTKNTAMQQNKNLSHLRYETIMNLCQQYHVDKIHAEHVKMTAIRIYDDLQPMHNLDDHYRELLEAAALLHDVGYHISHDQHHKHSLYIIQHCVMPGFTNNESELIANIARYHRKSHPKKKHDSFNRLSEEDQNVVRILGGILRIAEGIDRRQLQLVKDVRAEFANGIINIFLYPGNTELIPDIELWGAIRRKPLLEETLNRAIYFHIREENET